MEKKDVLQVVLSCLVVVAFSGALDYIFWGKPFMSYYNYYVFNYVHHVASIFGTNGYYYYFRALLIASSGLYWVCLLSAYAIWRKIWLPLLLIISVITNHLMVPHKEYRFIFIVIPLFMLILSALITHLTCCHKFEGVCQKSINMGLCFMVLISVFGFLGNLYFQKKIYKYPVLYRSDILSAYRYLSSDDSVKAIFNDTSGWGSTGGYYYLHKDIPIYDMDFPEKNPGLITHGKLDMYRYVTHVICRAGNPVIPGFYVEKRFKQIEIRRSIKYRDTLKIIKADTKNPLMKGIDGVYTPTVLPTSTPDQIRTLPLKIVQLFGVDHFINLTSDNSRNNTYAD